MLRDGSKYDTVWLRVGAQVVDGLILMPLNYAVFIAWCGSVTFPAMMVLSGLRLLAVAAYTIGLTATRGQTLGQMAAGVRILRVDGTAIAYKEAAMRCVPILALGLVWLVAVAIQLAGVDAVDRVALRRIPNWISWPSHIWFIAQVVTVFTNEKRRAIHDFMAGTEVVRLDIKDSRRTVVAVLVVCCLLGFFGYTFALAKHVTDRFRERIEHPTP